MKSEILIRLSDHPSVWWLDHLQQNGGQVWGKAAASSVYQWPNG